MSKPVTMTLTHDLGQAEAIRRIKTGVDGIRSRSLPVAIESAEWTDNILNFRIGALGMKCHGTVTVLENMVRLDVLIPGMLAYVFDKYLTVVRNKAQILLGHK